MLQPQNATAAALQQRSNGGANPSSRLPSIAKPDGVSADTHDLVLKTMRGGEQWGERKKADYDDALVALRVKRLAELRARAAKGGADGAAAALVSEQLGGPGRGATHALPRRPRRRGCARARE